MAKFNARLPREGLIEPEDGGHRADGSDDVEGHGLPLTAPPSLSRRGPSHGGENIPSPVDDDDDVEGHRRR